MKKTLSLLLFFLATILICNAQSNKTPIVKTNSPKAKVDTETYSFDTDCSFSETKGEPIIFTNLLSDFYRKPTK